METTQILILSLIQGFTEFLPISSSAHLILVPHLFGYVDQGLGFDIALHLGSLGAVIIYFRHDLWLMIRDLLRSLGGGETTQNARLAWMIIVATVPIVIVGGLFKTLVGTDLRSTLVIAIATIVFGLLLWWYDIRGKRTRDEHAIHWRDAVTIGLFQCLAIIPGTSRSGITMTAGLMLGLTRAAAARFSFLLSIPTILMSGAVLALDVVQGSEPILGRELLLGSALSFASAYLCIFLFLRLIEQMGMFPFVLYRLVLGAVLLGLG
ncbi:MAG TPA: undecaprenyl-diphosphate phosphatase [Sedimenticola thiotaurini]|uniref:Undecaprenyl-diphosphatase n=1 Tax=Sedimenticola thiotaurini TaxID=1543721 RepID=A0A831RNK5_9GAMM|nr:undecaprenyl-diphosphate phosphatase [Sedimenticola thiotaurini]